MPVSSSDEVFSLLELPAESDGLVLSGVLTSACVESSVVSSSLLIGGSGSASLEFDDLLSESVLSASPLGVCSLGSSETFSDDCPSEVFSPGD